MTWTGVNGGRPSCNNSLAAARPSDPLLQRRAAAEVEQIEKVVRELSSGTFIVPRLAVEPTPIACAPL